METNIKVFSADGRRTEEILAAMAAEGYKPLSKKETAACFNKLAPADKEWHRFVSLKKTVRITFSDVKKIISNFFAKTGTVITPIRKRYFCINDRGTVAERGDFWLSIDLGFPAKAF